MDKEMIFKIITLLLTSSVISAFIGSRTSLKQNDKNNALKYVTSERLSWGKNIRDLTTKFFSEPLERKVTLKTLEVNLNPYDIYDVNTLLLGEAIVNNKNYIYLINEKLFNKFFIRYSSKIFKKKSKEFYVDCFLRNKSYKEMVELNNLEHELSVLQGATTPNKERIKNLKKQIKKLKKRNKKVKKYLKKVTKKSFKNKSTLWVKVEKENFEEEFSYKISRMLKNDWERNKADTLSAFGKFLLNNVWISITVVALTLLLSGAFLWYDKYDSTETIKDFYHQNTYNGDIGYFDEQLDTIKDDLDDISTYVAWEKYKDFVPLETENKYTLEESKNIVYEIEYGDVENINNMVSGFSVEEQEKFKKLKETELENQRLYGYNYYEVDEVDMYFTELIKENSEQLEDVVLSYRLKLKSEENSEEINEFLQENIVIKVKTFIYTSMNLSGEMNLDTYKKFSDVEKYKYVLLEENIVDSLDILVLVLYGVVGYSMLIFFWIHTMKNSKRINRQDFFEKYSEEFYEKFKSMNRFS